MTFEISFISARPPATPATPATPLRPPATPGTVFARICVAPLGKVFVKGVTTSVTAVSATLPMFPNVIRHGNAVVPMPLTKTFGGTSSVPANRAVV